MQAARARAIVAAGGRAKDGTRYFVKAGEAPQAAMYAAEAEGLAALREAGAIRVPATEHVGEEDQHAWIVLEWLDLLPLDAASGLALGEQLAHQHQRPQPRFGWAQDNFIGLSPQANGWSDDWLAFWREKRLQAQLRMAIKNRYPSKMIDRGERLLADCEALFRGRTVRPSLLHGDLWSGNAGKLADGAPVVFDPAVYVGDHEADIAMTEFFGGFPGEFYSSYRNLQPFEEGYEVRRVFYNLYHQLNHANLFAGDYVRRSASDIERVLAELR